MQTYGPLFAQLYNKRWSKFARDVATVICDFHASNPISATNKLVLDVCCGTGQLALHFLQKGYRVVGIDISDHMLWYARKNTAQYVECGQAKFIQGDVRNFCLPEEFGLAVSTFNSINHLNSITELEQCFKRVFNAVVCEGFFIFDLNTRKGLLNWNSLSVENSEELLIISQGFYDECMKKAVNKITGFTRIGVHSYQRFDDVATNTAFDLSLVKQLLLDIGWRGVYYARIEDLHSAVVNAEGEETVFVVTRKQEVV